MEIKLADVPEMGYLSTDTEHGDQLTGRDDVHLQQYYIRYYKMPEKTKEAIDSEGWVHSGDIGMWLKTGQLKIIDRKK
ncbi:hypothetical protein FOL46_004910, partial [Perkinsus olseni]